MLRRLRHLATFGRALAGELVAHAGRRPSFRLAGSLRGRLDATARFTGSPARVEEAALFLFGGRADTRPLRDDDDGSFDLDVAEAWSLAKNPPPGAHLAQPWLVARARPTPDVGAYFERHLGKTLLHALHKGKKRLGRVRGDSVVAFYEELLLPTITARHGDGALIPPLAFFQSWNGRSTTLTIELVVDESGRTVGGAAVVEHHGEPLYTILASGVREDALDDRALRQEAKALLYEDVFRRAAVRGADVDLGLTRPFADDGVLAYKRRWGAELHPAPLVTKYELRVRGERAAAISDALHLLVVDGDSVAPA